MTDKNKNIDNETGKSFDDAGQTSSRRDFLRSLGKWSGVIIGAVTAANLVDPQTVAGWVNRGGGGSWVNGRGGGGWINGGGGGGWVDAGGGGGGSWINRR